MAIMVFWFFHWDWALGAPSQSLSLFTSFKVSLSLAWWLVVISWACTSYVCYWWDRFHTWITNSTSCSKVSYVGLVSLSVGWNTLSIGIYMTLFWGLELFDGFYACSRSMEKGKEIGYFPQMALIIKNKILYPSHGYKTVLGWNLKVWH